jgi:membrane fusion protein, heavy metal efflux system
VSRSIRVELSARNLALLFAALGLFAAVVAAATGLWRERASALHAGEQHEHAADHGEGHVARHEERHAAGHEEGHAQQEGRDEQKPGRVELSAQALQNAGIEVLVAGPGHVNVTLPLPGEVSLNQESLAHVTPRVAGAAREVKKQLGELVQKGDVLAIIDSRDLAEVQREFLAAKERLALAEATFQRAELLKNENISAEKDYLAVRQALAEAKIEHRSAAQKLQAIGGLAAGGGGYALVAPLTGTIIEKHINVGEVLSQETRAFTIADLSSIWVNVTVYARDLPRVAVGQAVEVRAEGIAQPAQGSIAYLGQVVGEQTRSALARIVLKNPGPAWRPGLFVTAQLVVDQGPADVVIEDEAVQTVEGKEVVFVQQGGGFDARAVQLGRRGYAPGAERRGRVIEVLAGVNAGDRYVSKNSFTLKAELGKSEAGHEH